MSDFALPPRVLEVVRQVAGEHGLAVREVLGCPGRRAPCRARWAIWAQLREAEPRASFPRIAMWFGVDHTTVQYGVRRHHGLPARRR